jgi:hypothetical protein
LSNSPQSLEELVTFFLDRTHQSRDTARLLRRLGIKIELHKNNFLHDAPDPDWIPVCAANGWIIVTGDKGIEFDGINRAAVIECAAKVFMVNDHQTRGLEQTAALIAARKKIMRTALQNVGPFYCSVDMASDNHVGPPRFQPGGYALKPEAIPGAAMPVPEPGDAVSQKHHDPPERSGELDFG